MEKKSYVTPNVTVVDFENDYIIAGVSPDGSETTKPTSTATGASI